MKTSVSALVRDALSSVDALALIKTWLRYPVHEATVELLQTAAASEQRSELRWCELPAVPGATGVAWPGEWKSLGSVVSPLLR